MNQKKCPKCGESNPPEAVMCWACYTPLTGGAAGAGSVAAATATAGARPQTSSRPDTARDEDDNKTGIAPWQIGAVVVALLLAGGFAFMLTRGSSSDSAGVVSNTGSAYPRPDTGQVRLPGVVPRGGASSSGAMPMTNLPKTAPNQASYTVTTPPARGASWATIGIMPTTSVTPDQAKALALIARQRLSLGRSFQGVYVYVFRTRAAASTFQQFQISRGGAPLTGGDYSTLSDIWPDTLLRYEYNAGNKSEDVRQPATDGSGWWSRESNYTPARD